MLTMNLTPNSSEGTPMDYPDAAVVDCVDTLQLPEFDLDSVAADLRDALQADTEQLHRIEAQSFALAVQRGLILNRWKERLPHGQFMAWRRWALPGPSGTGYSDQTYANWMNLAIHYPDVPQTLNLQLGAAYLLASDTVDAETRQLAIDLAKGGMKIDKRVAFVLACAPRWVIQQFTAGETSAKDAEAVTRTLKRYPPPIARFAERWQVTRAAAVDFIAYTVSNHNLLKKGDPHADTLLEELLATEGWMLAGEFKAHLSAADQSTIEAFLAERRRENVNRVLAEKYDSRRSRAIFRQYDGGFLMLDGLDPEFQMPAGVKPGDVVEIEIQVQRGSS